MAPVALCSRAIALDYRVGLWGFYLVPVTFDENYFDRYYFNETTRIADWGYFEQLARFIGSYVTLLDCPVDCILDVGCGPGLMHTGLRRAFPNADIHAFDVSEYVCRKFGWQCSSIEDYDVKQSYDLVVCHDVLQYLDGPNALRALSNLEKLAKAALFFSVLTREDWEQNCDQILTDGNTYRRSASWYRTELSRAFKNAGGGLYIKRDSGVVLYSLEHC